MSSSGRIPSGVTSDGFLEKRPQSLHDLFSILDCLADTCCFRGQTDAEWGLSTSFERSCVDRTTKTERRLITLFKRAAHFYIQGDHVPRSVAEWLALMQHHGAPTRLCDWTTSPYVALYFAVERATHETDSAVWAISSQVLFGSYPSSHNSQNDVYPGRQGPQLLVRTGEDLFNKVYSDNSPQTWGIAGLRLSRANQRMLTQQGLFTYPFDIKASYTENLKSTLGYLERNPMEAVIKIIVPGVRRWDILNDLQRMNISSATLFPGIDGFARSLRVLEEEPLSSRVARLEQRALSAIDLGLTKIIGAP